MISLEEVSERLSEKMTCKKRTKGYIPISQARSEGKAILEGGKCICEIPKTRTGIISVTQNESVL